MTVDLVLVSSAIPGYEAAFAKQSSDLPQGFDIRWRDEAEFRTAKHSDAEVLVLAPRSLIGLDSFSSPNLRYVHLLSSGTDALPQELLPAGVEVSSSSGVNSTAMAEFCIAALLAHLKGFWEFADAQRRSAWQRAWLRELTGQRVVVIGLGAVGMEVCRLASGLGCHVTGVARSIRAVPGADEIVLTDHLKPVLSEADAVFLCVSLNSETTGMVNADFLASLRPEALLVNVSRGPVVNEADLIAALDAGQLSRAVLDTVVDEPLPATSPLWQHPRVVITPHVSGTTQHFALRAVQILFRRLQAVRA